MKMKRSFTLLHAVLMTMCLSAMPFAAQTASAQEKPQRLLR